MKRFIFWVLALTVLSSCVMAEGEASNEALVKGIKNKLALGAEIDFLYELDKNREMHVFPAGNTPCSGKVISFLKRSWFWLDNLYEIKEVNAEEVAVGVNLRECKLEAIKEDLNITSNDTLTIIREAYPKLNYKYWDRDRIRFMTTLNYIDDLKDVVPSVGVMAFFAYKKYIPNRLDILRRTAIYASIGNSDKAKGGVYSAGLNIEIQDGFGINAGWSTYTMDNDDKEDTLTVGITLSSDLFKTFGIK